MEASLRLLLQDGKFTNVPPDRTLAMRAVRGKGNKSTEVRLRLALVRAGIRGWSMHARLIGKPDFLFGSGSLAVFVDGCSWNGCPKCGHVPRKNSRFWSSKIRLNLERDKRTNLALRRSGIQVLRFWEHELVERIDRCIERIQAKLKNSYLLRV